MYNSRGSLRLLFDLFVRWDFPVFMNFVQNIEQHFNAFTLEQIWIRRNTIINNLFAFLHTQTKHLRLFSYTWISLQKIKLAFRRFCIHKTLKTWGTKQNTLYKYISGKVRSATFWSSVGLISLKKKNGSVMLFLVSIIHYKKKRTSGLLWHGYGKI